MDRPQYGEYATPEEQRARAGLPPLDATAPPSAETPAFVEHPGPAAFGSEASGSVAKSVTPAGRVATYALLAFGLFNVLTSIPGFLDLSATLNQTLQMLGAEGEFSNFAAARTWGLVAVVVLVVGYAATAWLSIARLRRNRSAWWIPLVGFVVTMMIVSVCISVPMLGDPAFTQGLMTPPAG